MIWKELKKGDYKNYTYYIYGKYTEDYPTEIGGTEVYKEAIETSIKIINPLGDIVHENSWLNYELHNHKDIPYKYLIRFRKVYMSGWFYDLFPKIEKVIHIENDYSRVLADWNKYAEEVINGQLKESEKDRYEQEMTDGLPDSVFIKYLDR